MMVFNEIDNFIEVYSNLVIELVQCFGTSFFCRIDHLASSVIKFQPKNSVQKHCIHSITYKYRIFFLQDNSSSLLHYLVSQYIRKYDPLSSTEKSQLPLPEPSDITEASLVNFDEIRDEMRKVKVELSGCERRISKVVMDSSEENVEPFKTSMMRFLDRGMRSIGVCMTCWSNSGVNLG